MPTRRRSLSLACTVLALVASASQTLAAPPWLEGLGQYRILDASGRIAPRALSDSNGRVVLRPASPPPLLLRSRPLYLSGYAGAVYGPREGVVPTGHRHSLFHRAR